MKKINLIALIICATAMLVGTQSCKKYSDGPLVSLRSKTARVSNTWKVDNYKVNDNDLTSLVADYTETYTKDGNYYYTFGSLSGTGSWAFQNNEEEIKINGINNQASQTLYILKLQEKHFWYYYMDGNDKKEFHMIQE